MMSPHNQFFMDCEGVLVDSGNRILEIATGVIISTFFVSCILVPSLLKNLHSISKIYLVMQQLSGMLLHVVSSSSPVIADDAYFRHRDQHLLIESQQMRVLSYNSLSSSLGVIFHHQQYAFLLFFRV